MSITSYKNLARVPSSMAGSGPGGQALYDSMIGIVDRFGQIVGGGFNVKDYNSAGLVTIPGGGASGSNVTTTGDITTGTASLVVASAASFVIGQGILVKGAGAAGVHLVTTISNIVGTTITLANNAGTTVTGAVVQHDDTAAINTALAAAHDAGGGNVFVPSGLYRTNGPYNGSTNSILTIPQTTLTGTDSGLPIQIGLIGQATARMPLSGGICIYSGGTAFDCTDAPTPSGDVPAWFASSPWVNTSGGYDPNQWIKVALRFKDFATICPVSSPISGIQCGNAFQVLIDDGVVVFTQLSGGAVGVPASDTFGFYMPLTLNNVKIEIRRAQALGFDIGISGGEHLFLQGPYVNYCNIGFQLPVYGTLCVGMLSVQSCGLMIKCVAGAGYSALDIQLEGEIAPNGQWYSAGTPSGVLDAGDHLRGTIRYWIVNNQTLVGGEAISASGGANVHLINIIT